MSRGALQVLTYDIRQDLGACDDSEQEALADFTLSDEYEDCDESADCFTQLLADEPWRIILIMGRLFCLAGLGIRSYHCLVAEEYDAGTWLINPNSNAIDEMYALGVLMACLCLLYTSPSPRDKRQSRMPSSA